MPIAPTITGSLARQGIPLVLSSEYAISPGQDQPMKINLTKTAICALCFLGFFCATSAFAQNAPVLTNTSQPLQMSDHVQHASEHSMAQESSLLGTSSYTYAKGEQPLADLGTLPYETPLGDVARAYRKEHATAARAAIVLDK
jgi:hypothetical protein